MFPEVRAQGGFDIIVGNPPWEQFKGQEQEFFAQSAPHIAAKTSEDRSQAIDALQETDPALHQRWIQYRSNQERLAHWAKTCGRYTRTPNEANTYVLFTELAAQHGSHSGLVVKSGIATDAAQSDVWKALTSTGRVAEIRDIVNASPAGGLVFPAVAAVERFSVLVLAPPQPERPISAATMNFGVDQATTACLRQWSAADLRAISPRTRTLLSSANPDELDLALTLQKRFSTLDFADGTGENPWGISFHSLFHSSKVKKDGLALRPESLAAEGFILGDDKVFRHPDGTTAVPLLEGQMVGRWDHRARTYEGFKGANKYGRKPHIPWVTEDQHSNPGFEIEPRYWMLTNIAEARSLQVAPDGVWFLGVRSIGWPASNRRTLRAALTGRYPTTHSLPVISTSVGNAFALLALLNSMTFDFLVRLHMSGPNIVNWLVSQCAAPYPGSIPDRAKALAQRMSVTSERLAKSTGLPVSPWEASKREVWDADMDAQIARTYGLSRSDYEVVLDHFAPLRRAEDKQFGEYRSKRLRLDAFDRLARED